MQLPALTLLPQEGLPGVQRTLTHPRVLQELDSGGDLERGKRGRNEIM